MRAARRRFDPPTCDAGREGVALVADLLPRADALACLPRRDGLSRRRQILALDAGVAAGFPARLSARSARGHGQVGSARSPVGVLRLRTRGPGLLGRGTGRAFGRHAHEEGELGARGVRPCQRSQPHNRPDPPGSADLCRASGSSHWLPPERYSERCKDGLRTERALNLAAAEMYVQGVSTRKVVEGLQRLVRCGSVDLPAPRSAVPPNGARRGAGGLAAAAGHPQSTPYVLLGARLRSAYAKAGNSSIARCSWRWASPTLATAACWACRWRCRKPKCIGAHFSTILVNPGLRSVKLIVSEGEGGLKGARRAVLPTVPWQAASVTCSKTRRPTSLGSISASPSRGASAPSSTRRGTRQSTAAPTAPSRCGAPMR